MSNEKKSSLELAATVAQQTNQPKKRAAAFMHQLSATIEEALLRDGVVKVKGLGTFKITWHASRASVNVQTGERYEIAGHNKIVFTPENEMKEAVNQPYAHLDPVDLEGNVVVKEKPVAEEDPRMKRFAKQATEIMDMIADINTIQPVEEEHKIQPAVVQPVEEEKAAEDVVQTATEETHYPEEITSPVIPETEKEQEIQPVIIQPVEEEEDTTTTDFTIASDANSEADMLKRMTEQHSSKSKKWTGIFTIIILPLAIIAAATYFLSNYYGFLPEKPATAPVQKKIPAPLPDSTVVPVIDTVKRDTVQNAVNQPVIDSTKREYTKFIATETITNGSRLTLLAEKYYGHKAFWVYIYEANRAIIKNPDKIANGSKIKIPKLNPELIDLHNSQTLRQANALQKHYLQKAE